MFLSIILCILYYAYLNICTEDHLIVNENSSIEKKKNKTMEAAASTF